MKIAFRSDGCVDHSVIDRNVAHAKALGLPAPTPTGKKRLAVVGGAPSVRAKVDEIKAFDGDVWVIGSAYPWAISQGIHGVYFSIDPIEDGAQDCEGAHKAILSSCVSPLVFEKLKGKDVAVFDLIETAERLNHGVTTATAVPELALLMDYTEIVFYGCESCFENESHAYRDDASPMWLVVECGSKSFKTRPDYLMQCEYLSLMLRKFSAYFKEKSGGLLRQMIDFPEYDVTHVSTELFSKLKIQ